MLCRIHQIIRHSDDFVCCLRRVNARQYTNAKGDRPIGLIRSFENVTLDFGDGRLRGFLAGLRQQHCELVAAKPRNRIASPQMLPGLIDHAAQDLVAGGMPELVIHSLEVVNVNIGNLKRMFISL